MPQIGPAEILVILLVALLVFGPKRLPEIGRQVGRGMRELKRFQDTVKGELDEVLHFHEDDTPTPSSAEPSISAGDAPPALPAAEPGPTPAPAPQARPGSRPPSRFRAPGPPSNN